MKTEEQKQEDFQDSQILAGKKLLDLFFNQVKEVLDMEVCEYEDGLVLETYCKGKKVELHYNENMVLEEVKIF